MRERRLLLVVISICAGEKFAFKVTFETIRISCSTAVKRQVIPDLWSTNRKCFVSHDETRVRTAKHIHFSFFDDSLFRVILHIKQDVALTGRNRTGLPCSVVSAARPPTRPAAGATTVHAPAGSVTDDDRR